MKRNILLKIDGTTKFSIGSSNTSPSKPLPPPSPLSPMVHSFQVNSPPETGKFIFLFK